MSCARCSGVVKRNFESVVNVLKSEELAIEYRNGNENALLPLWDNIKRFAYKMAKIAAERTPRNYCDVSDLEQEAFIAMCYAAKTYNPAEECSFLSWYGYYLKTAFAYALGYSSSRIDAADKAISLETPMGSPESELRLSDLIKDTRDRIADIEEKIFNEELREALERLLDTIDQEAAQVLRDSFFEEIPVSEIARRKNIQVDAVYKQKHDGLKALRKKANSREGNELRAYIELNTKYYRPTNIMRFMNTHTSSVEETVFQREKLAREYKNLQGGE